MRRRTLGADVAAGARGVPGDSRDLSTGGWLSGALPADVRCGELGGSVWHGECLGLKYGDVALGDATWNLAHRQRPHRTAGRRH